MCQECAFIIEFYFCNDDELNVRENYSYITQVQVLS